jgi:hypothetical protein
LDDGSLVLSILKFVLSRTVEVIGQRRVAFSIGIAYIAVSLLNLPAENWKAGAVLRCLACFAGLGSGDEVGVVLFTGNKHLGARSRIPSVLSFAEHVVL